MQKLSLLFTLFVMSISIINAQSINESTKSMSLGKQAGFEIDIDGANEDIVEDVWKEFIKDFGKSKRNKKAAPLATQFPATQLSACGSPTKI